MKYSGHVSKWNDAQGFGFITPDDGGAPVFLHISGLARRGWPRPTVGAVVSYRLGKDERGRQRAVAVVLRGAAGGRAGGGSRGRKGGGLTQLLAAGALLAFGGLALTGVLPMPVFLLAIGTSLASWLAYLMDKSAAERGAWRISESTLHVLALLGGWPGALVAQVQFRHKTQKASFRQMFWTTLVLHVATLVWLATPQGAGVWRKLGAPLWQSLVGG